jgi:type IV pilus assembly protein PilV
MIRPISYKKHRNTKGFSLLETMIAVFIFALGLLGYIGMQSRTTQLNVEAEQREEAMRVMDYLVNAININRDARGCYQTIGGGEYSTTYAGTGNTVVFACNGFGDNETRTQANADLNSWDQILKGTNQGKSLINARGCVAWSAADEITVSVVWQGLVDSVDADPNNLCGSGLYDSGSRRLMTYTISFADLGA